ncbi:DUF1642 domain-containing protein [Enterococcus durans]|uniref:DUF1642 domain-containing protein n=1 Tax=Enterococcus durans TaxID=53345 RepID=UPI0015744541|nr:DUF1642 domain-containing protein [Enterococcus durans]MCH3356703.1 DUF1642 domain-containing protein [Enterococcus faecium]MBE9888661.1 DUF1642 domain-containing protein [Enterococcus durans]MCB8505784.1 DUF1642 domain-containing protein [Enterococcus durans]MCB8515673.1 DUF1642 domain-containing protein [Enterococcus durans]NTM12732.1 DUF1642 domain-containing protein [Enterococcus faecium]
MNKQELIDKWESKTGAPSYEISDFPINPSKNEMYIAGYGVARTEILKDLKQLDEPQKPKTEVFNHDEKFVVEWLDHTTEYHYSLYNAINDAGSEVRSWMKIGFNSHRFARALMSLDYEVEKEPLYRVKIGEGYFVEYQGRGALIMPDCNKEIKIFDSKSDAERTAQTIGGTVEEVAEG